MALPTRYTPQTAEPALDHVWQETGVYHFSPADGRPVYAIDTPPPTVSGHLHLGSVFSSGHPDFIARFWRMNGHNVFYPMGFDDNGLPTERLVERQLGRTAAAVGRRRFIQACLDVSEETERTYEALWRRLGLSVDWRYTYRTIDDRSRRGPRERHRRRDVLHFRRYGGRGVVVRAQPAAQGGNRPRRPHDGDRGRSCRPARTGSATSHR